MEYTFNYSDGRNYRDSISDGFRLEAQRSGMNTIYLRIFSSKENKITIILESEEASALAHCLLATMGSTKTNSFKISAG
jgi:hypothetical protein